ncbi:leucyl aminopeptidase [Rhizobium sp. CFBP 8762]|uniref:leucyl aminopeptidase n=1 Tax=Rhizobium sp. CFBP 8762 TaxID=2775279 RepID=UPI00177BBC98|nr:leucyl aminopeptidase [Rhizobium sp. CFBP 8762]MBD8553054.1 leucyl aminopeptidase [Rhizobium sp. CFBP 8762]
MPVKFEFAFANTATPAGGVAVIFSTTGTALSGLSSIGAQGAVAKAVDLSKFKGKALASVDLIAPHDSPADRILVIGIGEADKITAHDWLKIGGTVASKVKTAEAVTVYLDIPGLTLTPRQVADFALGMELNVYAFDRYKTKKSDDDTKETDKVTNVQIVTEQSVDAAFAVTKAIAEGVILARNLVNEPANVLGPVEFAAQAKALEALGVEVEILTEVEMTELGMGALLGVALGSERPPRLAVMQWKGGAEGEKPIAFIGKGVTFDTGGISIKPAAGMEDMKGDMGGAAAVTGLMHVLASRKARANVVGIIGLVENMPDGKAQRPGDIVTSMSGQTIEVINTDAEGRLVLCDALWYCNERFQPQFMVNLATLTGAVLVALGTAHAGLFSNDDALSEKLTAAGLATQEKLWRLPLGKDYDKMIDSKFADMKNTGGRYAGSITAAQFLQRYVKDTPWAHLDIAGTAMSSPTDEINQSWASGFGVRLLNELVASHYEH